VLLDISGQALQRGLPAALCQRPWDSRGCSVRLPTPDLIVALLGRSSGHRLLSAIQSVRRPSQDLVGNSSPAHLCGMIECEA
jgi:hypothetical protein